MNFLWNRYDLAKYLYLALFESYMTAYVKSKPNMN